MLRLGKGEIMQDRYRFRFWNKKTNKWFYFGFETFPTYEKEIWEALTNGEKIYQCTGLKDKNGKLIYEGDIVSVKIKTQDFFNVEEYFSENYKGEIIFKEGSIAIRVIDTKKQPISLYYYANGCEIIGNIYENPELLENKQ